MRWVLAENAVMGAEGAVEIVVRQDKDDAEKLAAREAEYKAFFANLGIQSGCAKRGWVV